MNPETYLSGTKNRWHIIHNGMPLCQGTKSECLQYAKMYKIQLPDFYWSSYSCRFIKQVSENCRVLTELYFDKKPTTQKALDMLDLSYKISLKDIHEEYHRISDLMNDVLMDSKEHEDLRVYFNFLYNQIKNRS